MNATTNQWLQHILSITKYINKDRVYNEIKDVINTYSGLTPKYDKYVGRGTSDNLLGLTGVIPVSYRNVNYNIPIGIWLLYSFPNSPPEFVVMPTENMKIVVSKHVNNEGKISHPYLSNWHLSHSSILEFISIIRGIFSIETPVVETKSVNKPMPFYQPNRYNVSPPNLCVQPRPPPPPPQQTIYNRNSYIGSTSQPMFNTGPPAPYNYNIPVSLPTTQPTSMPMPTSMPLPQPRNTYLSSPMNNLSNQNKLGEDSAKNAIIKEVQNKLKSKINDFDKDMKITIDKLLNDNKDLNDNEKKVNNSMHLFEEELLKVNNNITLFQGKNIEISQKIDQLKNREEINADDIITATPLMKQLMNASAEECAIEDMVFYLGKALSSEKINLNFYLKNIRSLSREQFLKKVLIKKIRAQAQLL